MLGRRFERVFVVMGAIAAGALGLVHGQVRVSNQVVGVLAILGKDRYADAARQEDALVADFHRLLQVQHQARGHLVDVVIGLGTAQHDAELVAAESRHRILLADRFPDASRCHRDGLVARIAPHHVVDLLEVVEIDEQDRNALALARSVLQDLLELLGEVAAVRHPGQVVEIGLQPHQLLIAESVGDVASDLRGADDDAVRVEYRRNVDRQVDQPTVLASPDGFELLDPFPCSDARQDRWLLVRPILGNDRPHGFADHFFGGVAQKALCCGIPAFDDSGERLADDDVVGRLDDGCAMSEVGRLLFTPDRSGRCHLRAGTRVLQAFFSGGFVLSEVHGLDSSWMRVQRETPRASSQASERSSIDEFQLVRCDALQRTAQRTVQRTRARDECPRTPCCIGSFGSF